jgi:hypothetical protein
MKKAVEDSPVKKKRSGWDFELKKDKERFSKKGFSDYFFKGTHFEGKKDLIRKGFSMANAFVRAMDLPFKPLLATAEEESFSTGKVIVLATEVFDSDLPEGKQLDVFIGLAIHECLHCEKTGFDKLSDFITSIPIDIKKIATKRAWNTLEDERIDQ